MGKTKLNSGNLVYNTPIKRRIFKTDSYDKSIDTHYRYGDNKNKKFHTSVQNINVWFHYLKLILEMEELGMKFTKKNIKNPNVIDSSVIGFDIKINRKKYDDWDLDKVLRQPFSKWWRNHKNIFRNSKVNTSSYPYEVMVLNYNIMVRYLNGQSNFDIFLDEKNRFRELRTTEYTRNKLGKKIHGRRMNGLDLWTTYTKWWKMREEPSQKVNVMEYNGQTITKEQPTVKGNLEDKLLNASEQIVTGAVLETQDVLLGVCEGSFVKKIKLTYDPKTGKRGIPKL